MTRTIHTVSHSVPVRVCLQLMQQHGFRHLPVVDEHGEALGVVSDYGVLRAHRQGDVDDWVCEITQTAVAFASSDDLATTALARQLRDHRDYTMVVDENNRPVGIFTDRDGLGLAKVCVRPWMMVDAVMSSGELSTVSTSDKADAALRTMLQNNIRHLLVMDDGKLCGVLSHRDLVGLGPVPVGSLVPDPLYTARPETPLETAVALMVRHGVGCLPVITQGRHVAGVLTRTDVLRALTQELVKAALLKD